MLVGFHEIDLRLVDPAQRHRRRSEAHEHATTPVFRQAAAESTAFTLIPRLYRPPLQMAPVLCTGAFSFWMV